MSGYDISLLEKSTEKRGRRGGYRRPPKRKISPAVAWIIFLLVIGIAITLVVFAINGIASLFAGGIADTESPKMSTEERIAIVKKEADFIAAGYDYDKAVAKIQSFGEDYTEHEELANAIAGYETAKAGLVRHADVTDITHVFFHTMIVDNSRAFDSDYTTGGNNQFMTTISEFNKMLDEMYKRNFVLINLHDMAMEKQQSDGSTKFVPGDIMLPPGKKPMVMSQDDVSYYEYMKDDGYASKIIIGEDGYPTCVYTDANGVTTTGDYDLVPLLEKFIQEHPDFSYRGARATLAITGYNGVLGYRTMPDSPTYDQDVVEAKKVADRMKELGWVFASHSWGHINYGSNSLAGVTRDADRWDAEVRPILGDTDILIYPHGSDIGGVGTYSGDKFEMLKKKGFKFFCNVDGNVHWVHIRDNYVRQGRRNLDGYRMWYNPEKLTDLFDVKDVWDNDRPTPVPPM